MGLLTFLIFQELLNLKKDCNTFEFNSEQYDKCIKLQKLSALIYEQLQKDYFEEFQQLQKLQESEKFQQYQETLQYFYLLIDENMDNYLAPEEQQQIFKTIVSTFYLIDFNDDGFTPPGE